MKKLIIMTIVAAIGAVSTMNAQPLARRGGEAKKVDPEKTIENKVQRMQEQLLLDDKQGEKFAVIYKDYLKAQQDLKKQYGREEKAERGQRKQLTDDQIVERQKQRLAFQKKSAELKEEYYGKMSKVLTPRQLEKVFFGKDNGNRRVGKAPVRREATGKPAPGNANRNKGRRQHIQICPAPTDTVGPMKRPSL
ncbi:MAG: hypothetical protein ACI4AH_05030 [Muribaculaceae bacterium]